MADRPVELHAEAEEEYLNALAWYCERSLPAGIKFERAFRQAIERIENFPERWPTYFVRFRKYTLQQFPFSVIYRNEPSRTFVLAVVHGRRRPGYWRGRA